MALFSSKAGACGASALVALAAALVLHFLAPPPNAQPSHGGEDAFATGLHERELVPGRGPQRWTSDRAGFDFRHLPPGPAFLEVRIKGHRTPVSVLANDVAVGVIEVGRFVGRYALRDGPKDGAILVELRTPGFASDDGAARGALVDRVKIVPSPAAGPDLALLASFVLCGLAVTLLAGAAGLPPDAAAAVAVVLTLLQALSLGPDGLLRSPYAATLAAEVVLAAALALVGARLLARRRAGSAPWAFVALLVALVVQWLAATSPLMVSSDVVFHANRLRDVAAGDYFPTSVTQHAVPFRIPYGVSFYALLAPLTATGIDRVALVRAGAGFANVAASAGLLWLLLPLGGPRAALAVVMLQVLPGTFDIYSFGNLANAFGQAVTALFFFWWVGGMPGGALVGAGLLALGCLSHLSSLIVLGALLVALLAARGAAIRGDRVRLVALAIGLALALLYYLHFAGLIGEQLPRLLEGGGQGRGASRGAWDAFLAQLRNAGAQWGIPAILLAAIGRPQPKGGPLYRDLTAYMIGVGLLALPAIASPLEVRYLYALGVPIAIAAADGFRALRERGRIFAALAWTLLLLQGALAAHDIVDALLYRYRS